MRNLRVTFVFLTQFLLLQILWGAEYHVSTSGNDSGVGTIEDPWQTISKAAGVMKAGDVCYIQAGVYRETVTLLKSGSSEKPIRFVGATNGEGHPAVVIKGTDVLKGDWDTEEVEGPPVYSYAERKDTNQLFYKNRLMTYARWPDQKFNQIWDRSTWAKSAEGSKVDLMVCEDLSTSGIDWTGAIATLNVGQQFKTWTRTVLEHGVGNDRFTYELNERLDNDNEEGRRWWDDRFYLSGKKEALTAPEEWFYDKKEKRYLFIAPEGEVPEVDSVEIKQRDFGFLGNDIQNVKISGIQFFGCTFTFNNSHHMLVENCEVLYPNYALHLTENLPKGKKKPVTQTHISGNYNTVRKVRIAYGNTGGIKLVGSHNVVDNSIVHDVCWNGSIQYPGIYVLSGHDVPSNSVVKNSTIYNCGNIAIWFLRQKNLIERNHVYDVGLACKDIAAIHTGNPSSEGSVVRYNWVHGSRGKGIRADDQSRNVSFYNNVIWDCREGMIVKGDHNFCFNNTIIGEGKEGSLILPTRAEPKKWWAKHAFLDVQNSNSVFCNNLVGKLVYRGKPLPDNENISHNVELPLDQLKEFIPEPVNNSAVSPEGISIVVDTGRTVPRMDLPYDGASPDLGAYESGVDKWKPGANWIGTPLSLDFVINTEAAH